MTTIEFTSYLPDDDAAQMAHVRLGVSLETAKQTPLYRFLMQRLAEAKAGALQAFLACDPANAREVAKHQARMLMCDEMPVWIDEQIVAGQHAGAALHDRYETDDNYETVD